MATQYRGGLVGCGRIGALWEPDQPVPLTHAGAMTLTPQIDLVAGASRGREHLEAFGRRFGVTALYTDYAEMLGRERLDILSIATPPALHRPVVEAAVANGVRAILCEKPLALSLADGDAIVAACRRAGCVLAVNHSRRWNPSYDKARGLVEQGAIGDLVSMLGLCQGIKPYPAWEAKEEGPLLHDAVHTFDLFRMFGGDARWAVGTALKRTHPYRVEDDSQAIFELAAGVSAVALVNERTRYARFEMELHGTTGKLLLDDRGHQLWSSEKLAGYRAEPDPLIEWWRLTPAEFPAAEPAHPILAAMQQLVRCIETGERPNSAGEDGVASLEMCMAVYESQLRDNARIWLPLARRESQLYALRAAGQL